MGTGERSPAGWRRIPGIHVWQSVLTPRQLSARLRLRAGAVGPDWRLRWKPAGKGCRLRLEPTLFLTRVRGQFDLRLWVRETPEGCNLTGIFLPDLPTAAFALLAPPLLLRLAAGTGGPAFSWRFSLLGMCFLLAIPRLATVFGRDRRLLAWVETVLRRADETKGEDAG